MLLRCVGLGWVGLGCCVVLCCVVDFVLDFVQIVLLRTSTAQTDGFRHLENGMIQTNWIQYRSILPKLAHTHKPTKKHRVVSVSAPPPSFLPLPIFTLFPSFVPPTDPLLLTTKRPCRIRRSFCLSLSARTSRCTKPSSTRTLLLAVPIPSHDRIISCCIQHWIWWRNLPGRPTKCISRLWTR